MSQTVNLSLPRHSHIGNFDYKRQIHPERSMKLKSYEKSSPMIHQRTSKFVEESKDNILRSNIAHSDKKSPKNKLTTRSMEVSTSLNSQNVTLLTRSGKIESSHKILPSNKEKGLETDKLQELFISVSESRTPMTPPLRKENLVVKHKTQHTPSASVTKNGPTNVLSSLKSRKYPDNNRPEHHVKSFSDGEEGSFERDRLKIRSSIIGEASLGTKNSVVAVIPAVAPLLSAQKGNRKTLSVDTGLQNGSFQQAEITSIQTAEKFAWSKFQSSPDPKELPLPSFLLNASVKSPLSAFTNTRVKSRSVSMMDADTVKVDLLPEFNNEDTETQSSQTLETSTENEESEKEPLSKNEELKTILSTFNKIAGKKSDGKLMSNDSNCAVASSLPSSNPANALKQLLGLGKG